MYLLSVRVCKHTHTHTHTHSYTQTQCVAPTVCHRQLVQPAWNQNARGKVGNRWPIVIASEGGAHTVPGDDRSWKKYLEAEKRQREWWVTVIKLQEGVELVEGYNKVFCHDYLRWSLRWLSSVLQHYSDHLRLASKYIDIAFNASSIWLDTGW